MKKGYTGGGRLKIEVDEDTKVLIVNGSLLIQQKDDVQLNRVFLSKDEFKELIALLKEENRI